jgi:glycosyltransferase involved in cell wall biosynthesis
MIDALFAGRVGLQQRVVPSYRAVFLDRLASACAGGLEVFAGKPLQKEGIDSVVDLESARLVHARNINFFDPSSSMYLCWQNGFAHWLEDWQPEVLIVEANPRYPATRRAISWMHRKGRKVIGWGLGAPALSGPLAFLWGRERYSFLRTLDAIIAYSSQGAVQYQQLGLDPEKVYIAFNAVDAAPQFPPPDKAMAANARATVLFVGRLQYRKRVDLLLKACASLSHDLQPHLVVIGDGPARSELENLACQVYPEAEFIGAKHGQELEPFFLNADLFVLPGTGGLAVQQAMAHGLPIIVAQGDGTQDDLVRRENGWQVPVGDLPALIHVLHQALSDPAELKKKGNTSYQIVANEINVEKMVEVFIRVLNDVSGQAD